MILYNLRMNFIKSLSLKYLIVISSLILLGAILNNIFQPQEKQVEWIGGQEVLATPEDL